MFEDIFNIGRIVLDGKATLCGPDGPVCRVTVEEPMRLLEYATPGTDGTVFIGGGFHLLFRNWAMNTARFTSLFESPDMFVNLYRRSVHNAFLFIGDVDGIVWCPTYKAVDYSTARAPGKFLTHSDIIHAYAEARKAGTEWTETPGLNVVGHPKLPNVSFSGAILPKGGDVDATYVSCWTTQWQVLKPMIDQVLKKINAQPPIIHDKCLVDFEEYESVPWA